MGIPKFFRWLSERYPLINEVITDGEVGVEFDNLYLDMNGIIHNCSHPDDNVLYSMSEEEIMVNIFKYIEILVATVKPQRVLYLAVDGVAPRAKMNQQRARRFRTAKEAAAKIEEARSMGKDVPEKVFDSNCITPGTAFMVRLSQQLEFFILKKKSDDQLWQSIEVIYSGHETPGEGEHKIMEYIRHAKAQPDYNPDLVHCMYGLDADLIMLSLATHERHFALLREEGILSASKKAQVQSKKGNKFHLLHISLLREYFELELTKMQNQVQFPIDVESFIDDFVLLCFFVGNDFVPTLPGLDIAEGSLDTMFQLYKGLLPSLNGYIVENGRPVFSRLEMKIADFERSLFMICPEGIEQIGRNISKKVNDKVTTGFTDVLFGCDQSQSIDSLSNSREDDEIWKNSYYREKFGSMNVNAPFFLDDLKQAYVESICWIVDYYYQGCVSWSWFYPYHYAPLVSDLVNLSSFKIAFEMSKPFKPLQQLLGVLPAASRAFLPPCYRELMTNLDSPMISYYPMDFDTDLNGKTKDWEAIVLIPFINAELLQQETEKLDASLTDYEIHCNTLKLNASIYHYDRDMAGKKFQSLLPTMFSDILDCHVRVSEYVLPPIPEGVLSPFKLVRRARRQLLPPGMPTLKSLPLKCDLQSLGVNVFGNSSRKKSLQLTPIELRNSVSLVDVANDFLGKSCSVWPYNREYQIENVNNNDCSYRVNVSAPFFFDDRQSYKFEMDAEVDKRRYKNKMAVDVDDFNVLVYARPLRKSFKDEQSGKVTKFWQDYLVRIPLPLVYTEPVNEVRYNSTKVETSIVDAILDEKLRARFLQEAKKKYKERPPEYNNTPNHYNARHNNAMNGYNNTRANTLQPQAPVHVAKDATSASASGEDDNLHNGFAIVDNSYAYANNPLEQSQDSRQHTPKNKSKYNKNKSNYNSSNNGNQNHNQNQQFNQNQHNSNFNAPRNSNNSHRNDSFATPISKSYDKKKPRDTSQSSNNAAPIDPNLVQPGQIVETDPHGKTSANRTKVQGSVGVRYPKKYNGKGPITITQISHETVIDSTIVPIKGADARVTDFAPIVHQTVESGLNAYLTPMVERSHEEPTQRLISPQKKGSNKPNRNNAPNDRNNNANNSNNFNNPHPNSNPKFQNQSKKQGGGRNKNYPKRNNVGGLSGSGDTEEPWTPSLQYIGGHNKDNA